MTLRAVLVVASVLSVGSAGPAVLAQRGEAPPLEGDAREALDKKWKDWRVATPQAVACQTDGMPPTVATADLDGDGQIDAAAIVEIAAGPQLVALLRRQWGFDAHELGPIAGPSDARYMSIEPRGKKFINPTNGLDDYFPNATVALHTCDKATTVYIWTGIGFRSVAITK